MISHRLFSVALIALFSLSIATAQAAGRIHAITNAEIQGHMKKNPGKKAVLFVHTSWCAPCKKMEEFLDQVIAQLSDILFFDVDGDKAADVKKKYGVTHYPTTITLDEKGIQIGEKIEGGFSSAESYLTRIRDATTPGKIYKVEVSRTPQEAAGKQPAPMRHAPEKIVQKKPVAKTAKRRAPAGQHVGKTRSGKPTAACRVRGRQ